MAVFDAHLKLGDIKGESKHKDHTGEIALESFNIGANQTGTAAAGGGMGAGKVALHDIHCVAKIDKSTPFVFHATATGKHFATGTITCRKAGGSQEKFYVLELKDVLVSGFQFGGSTQSDIVPMVQFSLNCAEIVMEYLEQDSSGKTTSAGKKGYNTRESKAVG
jgi:type VI secretion system secreted protein Hcp